MTWSGQIDIINHSRIIIVSRYIVRIRHKENAVNKKFVVTALSFVLFFDSVPMGVYVETGEGVGQNQLLTVTVDKNDIDNTSVKLVLKWDSGICVPIHQ